MLDQSPRLTEWAQRLRVVWFTELEQALDVALPGATDALVHASAVVDDPSGALHIRLPSIHPVLPPVYNLVRSCIASLLWDEFGLPLAHRVTFGGAVSGGAKPSGLSVYQPGDPAPDRWDDLITSFRQEVLTAEDPDVQALLGLVTVRAVGREHVWLAFPTLDARRRLGRLPGAATGLHDRLAAWNGGATAFCFATTE